MPRADDPREVPVAIELLPEDSAARSKFMEVVQALQWQMQKERTSAVVGGESCDAGPIELPRLSFTGGASGISKRHNDANKRLKTVAIDTTGTASDTTTKPPKPSTKNADGADQISEYDILLKSGKHAKVTMNKTKLFEAIAAKKPKGGFCLVGILGGDSACKAKKGHCQQSHKNPGIKLRDFATSAWPSTAAV